MTVKHSPCIRTRKYLHKYMHLLYKLFIFFKNSKYKNPLQQCIKEGTKLALSPWSGKRLSMSERKRSVSVKNKKDSTENKNEI